MKHAAIAAFLLAAGSASAEEIKVDVGLDKPVVIDTEQPLKLALFIEIGTNSAVQSTITGVEKMAAKYGFSYDVFDARFDVARQINQMETALFNGYNAWIVVP